MKKIDYWQREIDEITLISHYEEVFEKILKEFEKEEPDFGCWFFRFRMIPKSILESNDYSIENKKYVLKQMYLTLKEHNDSIHFNDLINEFFLLLEPYKEISDFVFKTNEKDKVDLYLKDFLVNPPNEYKLPEIQQKFNKAKGKEMANAIYLLRHLGILTYDINSKTKGRKNLAELLNPNIKMNGVNMFFEPGTYELKNAFDDDLDPIKKWLNSL